ncbi:MAG: hypothetical protein LCH88_15120 [Proteobacteria bacterium]|nr:hypothetical protein [Pseudomonadota bacterium]
MLRHNGRTMAAVDRTPGPGFIAGMEPGTGFVPPQRLRMFGRDWPVPATRLRRRLLGWGFIVGGLFSFLPVLGPWMFPVGFLILSVDSPLVRRTRRRLAIRIGRRWPRLNARLKPGPGG